MPYIVSITYGILPSTGKYVSKRKQKYFLQRRIFFFPTESIKSGRVPLVGEPLKRYEIVFILMSFLVFVRSYSDSFFQNITLIEIGWMVKNNLFFICAYWSVNIPMVWNQC